MIKLFDVSLFETSKSRDKLPLKCCYCEKTFYKTKALIKTIEKHNEKNKAKYCSRDCQYMVQYKIDPHVTCNNCGKVFVKQRAFIKRTANHFCSRSCAATFNNRNKTHGTRRSKLELWLQENLTSLYSTLEIHYNQKEAINSELDIYIPSLNLAFELNGIFHYEPIFGSYKLSQIQNNDQRKFQACLEQQIELCVIDVSGFKYFKEQTANKYLNIITEITNRKL
jgi:hypothetical protein